VAARAATPIAATASAINEPAGPIGPCNESRRYAQVVKCALICSAADLNRRSHPRTVPAGTPILVAIRR
jgi:hypothetical protein